MITNTELEYKGDQFPSKIISYYQEVDSIFFNTDNNVVLKITILPELLKLMKSWLRQKQMEPF